MRELPFRPLFGLFGAFILACGFTHFLDAVTFETPVYRLSGTVKLLTAVISWATVIVLVPTLPRIVAYADSTRPPGELTLPPAVRSETRLRDYTGAVLVAVVIILIRGGLDRFMGSDHLFVLPLLGVMFIAWKCGFGPALVCLLASMAGVVYFFVEPRNTFVVEKPSDQLAVGLFLFCGFAASLLGETQRSASKKAADALREQRRVTAQLADSETRLRAFIDNSPASNYVKDQLGRYVLVNQSFVARMNQPVENILGKTDEEILPPEVASRFRTQDDTIRSSFEPRSWEDTFPINGKQYTFLTFKFLLPDGTIGGIGTDLTLRKQAEEALKQSEARFRLLADAMPQIVWVTTPDGQHEHFNSRWYEYTGLTVEESEGWGWVIPLHPEDKPRAEEAWNKATATGGRYEIEYRFRRADGQYRWFLGRAMPVKDEAGHILRWFGTCTDIDDQKRQAAALQESEATLRAFYDNSPLYMGVVELLPDGDIRHLYDNPATCRFFGVAPNATAGRRATDLGTPPDVQKLWRAKYEESDELDAPVRFTHTIGSGPDARWLTASVCPLPGGTPDRPRFCYVAEDVTEIRRSEAALRASEERAAFVRRASGVGFWYCDLPFDVLEWDERVKAHFHLPADARVTIDTFYARIHPDDREPTRQAIARSIEQREGYDTVYRTVHPDTGEVKWVRAIGRTFYAADGTPKRFDGVTVDVTAQRQSEAAAREAADKFQSLADSIPQLAWMTDASGYIFWYNRRWYEYTGSTPEQMQGWGWQSVHDPDELPRIMSHWKASLAAGEPWEDTFPLRRHDGAYRWFLSRARPIRDEGGRIVRWVGTNTDVTEQRELEAQLRAALSDFRQLTEGLPQMVWACSPAGECDYLSQQWVEYTGRPAAEQMPYGWLDAVHPDDREPTMTAWRQAVSGLGRYDIEYRLRRADGEHRWFRVVAIPLNDATGRVTRWVGSSIDIHERKQGEEELRASERRFRLLTDAVPNLVWNTDAAGRATFFNRQWLEYAGAAAAGGWTSALHPDDFERVEAGWRNALAAVPDRHEDEFRLRRHDGEYRWFKSAVVPLRQADGRVDQWIGAMADVDDQKRESDRLEGLVAVRTTELQRSNGELEKFAYVASHDLQEPLRKIQAFGDRLRQRYREVLADQGRDYLDRMLSSAERMRTLINDLLAFSRVTSKAQPFAQVDLGEVARGVVSDLEFLLHRTGGRVEVGTLPTVTGDPTQLRQLFQNLIGNGLKFHKQGVPPVVTVSAAELGSVPADADPPPQPGPGWRLAVADNGIGFEQQYADRIFELFQRLHGRGEYEGTGIGLAVCKKIVERHGGVISARGLPSAGATFVVDLPA